MSEEVALLGQRAYHQIRKLIEVVGADEMMAPWRPAGLPKGELAPHELIDAWRAWLRQAGFGEEFLLHPHASPPNRYWDPAVTRLWNHHAVVVALHELCEFAIDARTLRGADLDEFLQAAPWTASLDLLDDIGRRVGAAMADWFGGPA